MDWLRDLATRALRRPEHEPDYRRYLERGGEPWGPGYLGYRWNAIEKALADPSVLAAIVEGVPPADFGYRLDERIVEYAWVIGELSDAGSRELLDAGSALNYEPLLDHPALEGTRLTIQTFAPENRCFWRRGISYQFGDLREIPFRTESFDTVVSISTIEHIGMDNSIYGWSEKTPAAEPACRDYLEAVQEMLRVLRPQGRLLMTFPYGTFENHGFFQQFDRSMLAELLETLSPRGESCVTFFRYTSQGWSGATAKECDSLESYNPHTGHGKGEDGAAHCRGICCLKLLKRA